MHRALILWLAAEVALLAWIARAAMQLPNRVAVHFDASGLPNGWMSRGAHLGLFAALALIVPAIVFGAFSLARWGSPRRLNVPHPEYWRSPEHYPEACAILRATGAIMAIGVCAWLGVLHTLIVRANRHNPPQLPAAATHVLSASLVAFAIGCVIVLWLRFQRIPGRR